MKQGKNTVDGIAHIRIVRTIRKGIVNDGLAVADHPHAGGGIVVISIHLGNGLAQNIRRGHLVDGGLDIIIKIMMPLSSVMSTPRSISQSRSIKAIRLKSTPARQNRLTVFLSKTSMPAF